MTRETKAAILYDAIERAYVELDTVKGAEMRTPEFRTLLKNLTDMEWLLEKATGSCYVHLETPMQPTEPTTVSNEVQPEAPGTEPVPSEVQPNPEKPETESTKTDEPQYKMGEVRAALAKARGKGVNVSEIITSFGVSNFQQITKEQYPAIMRILTERES